MKKLLLFLTCMYMMLNPATLFAWQPSGWVWFASPNAYDHSNARWYYFSETDSQFFLDWGTGEWNSVTTASGWHYFEWPWSYSWDNQEWNYWSQTDLMYVMNWTTGDWSRFGAAGSTGDVQVTLTWNNTADLDLYVTEPNGETIYYGNRQSATGGQLDVDDRTGFGPENIFWPPGEAPSGRYSVTVKHFSGALPSSWRVVVTLDGQSTEYRGTLTSSREEQLVVEFDYDSTAVADINAIQPLDGATVQGYGLRNQQFEWTPVDGAVSYRFELRPDGGGATRSVTHDVVTSSGVWATELNHGNYIWRVAARGPAGELGPWSPWFTFTYQTPQF